MNVLVFLAFTLPMSGQQPSPGDPRVAAYVEALRESLPANVPIQDAVASLSVYDNILPMLVAGGDGGGGVAHGAHIGGFVAGVAVAWVLSRREVQATPPEFRAEAGAVSAPAPLVSQAAHAGDMATAARAYFALSPRQAQQALDPAQSLALGRWLAESGHGHAALTVFRRHLQAHPVGPEAAEAHVGAGMTLLEHLDQPTAAYQHLRTALQQSPAPEVAAEARAGLAAIASRQKLPALRFSA